MIPIEILKKYNEWKEVQGQLSCLLDEIVSELSYDYVTDIEIFGEEFIDFKAEWHGSYGASDCEWFRLPINMINDEFTEIVDYFKNKLDERQRAIKLAQEERELEQKRKEYEKLKLLFESK